MATLNNVITNANGCVGIGTTSPAQLLELKKTTGSAIALLNYNDSVKLNINASSAGAGYLGMVTNHDLIFVTNDTERARLNTSGYLGIGTSNPGSYLHIYGQSGATGEVRLQSSNGRTYALGSTGTAYGSANNFIIYDITGAAERLRITSDGNLLVGNSSGTGYRLNVKAPFSSVLGGAYIEVGEYNQKTLVINNTNPSVSSNLFEAQKSGSAVFVLNSAGNVGIGTTSPTRKLHIDGGATTTVGIYIDANGISGTDIEQSSDAFRFQIRDNIPALFYTNNTERIRIASDGNVGIGTSSPVSKLHLDDATAPYITITRTGVPTWQLRNNFPVNQYGFSFNNTTAGTTPLFIGAGGNIGIGTSGPTNRLDVVGGSGTTFNMSNDGDSQRGGKLTFISSSATGRQFYVGTTSAIYNLVFGIDSVEKARIDTSGNLGINTTSPSAKLHVSASASTTAGIFQGVVGIGLTPTSAVPRLQIYGTSTTNAESRLAIYTSNTGTAFNNGLQLAVASDSVTSLINYSNTALYFGTNSTERMRITSTGNVGIGTTSPSNKLYVNGDGYFASTLFIADNTALNFGNTSQIYHNSSRGTTQFTGTGGSDTMCIKDSNGYVGIGTTSPNRKLQVDAETNGPALRLTNTNSNSGIELLTAATKYSWLLGAQYNIDGTFEITPSTAVGGTTFSTPTAVFTQTGNVGIGTTSPLARLHVTGSSSVPAAILMGNVGIGTTSFVYSNAARGDVEVYGSTDALISLRNATANSYLQKTGNDFYLNNGGAGFISITTNTSERMRITSDGNVGIGTSSPGEKLGILNGNIQLLATSGDPYIRLTDNGVRNWYLKVVDTSDYFEIGGTNATSLVVTGAGNVGIGTTSPTATLDVSKMEYPSLGGILASFTAGTTTPTTEKYVYLKQTYTGAAYDSPMLVFRANANSVNSGSFGTVRTTSNGSIAFSNVNATSGTVTAVSEKMRIQADGYVGIGTTSPAGKLHIVQNNDVGRYSYFGSNSGLFIKANDNSINNLLVLENTEPGANYGVSINFNLGYGGNQTTAGTAIQGSKIVAAQEQTWTSTASTQDAFLAFYTALNGTSSEKVRITSDGNVGIGTTKPTGSLSVIQSNTYSSFRSNGSGAYTFLSIGRTASEFEVGVSGGSNQFFTGTTAGDAVLKTLTGKLHLGYASAAPAITVDLSNNVGIGTTTPFGAAANRTVLSVNGTTDVSLNIGSGGSQRAYLYGVSTYAELGTIGSLPLTFAPNNSEKMRLNVDGNVGIGTSSPGTKLEVVGSIRAGSFPVLVTNTGEAWFGRGSDRALGSYTLQFGGTSATSTFFEMVDRTWTKVIFAVSGEAPTNAFYLGSTGNVGIGTGSPVSKLTIQGDINVNYNSTSTNYVYRAFATGHAAGNRGAILRFGMDDGAFTGMSVENIASSNPSFNSQFIDFKTHEGGVSVDTRMRITPVGNVGIGTTAPAYKLEVNGSLYATRLSGSAMFTTNGKGRFYGTASYALASAGGGSSLTGQTDSVTPFETSLGHQAGNSNTGTGNTAIGYQALFSNTTGTGSIAIGYQALYSNTRGKRNIAIGYEALRTTQGSTDGFGDPIGDENVAIGYQAARAAFNINRVVAIGHRALAKNLAGGNVAIGWLAMESNVGTANSNLGILNTAVGTMALSSNTSGNANSAFGYLALNANTTGNENTAVGHRSMLYNTTGKNNCSFGSYALYYNQIAKNNSAFGAFALYSNTTNNNSAFGYKALRYNTTGVNNDAFGYQALYSNISGKGNSAFGFQALKYTTTATGNSAFGRSALTQCSGGARNSAFGYYSSGAITGNPAFGGSGMDNCSFGYRSLRFNNSGNNNTAVGKDALYNNKVSNQTAIGYNALLGSTTGNGGNTAVGSNAGSAITFGYRNTMIGNNAGATGAAPLTTGQNNTCLGNGAITSTATVSNEITLGDSNITSLRCNRTTITSLSDFRDKTDINNVQVGLSFVEKLRPVTFKWDKREWYTDGNRDGSKKDTITQIGFIAQELKALQESENATYLNLVYESNPDKLEATPGNLMIPLIKAVQELNAIVKQQRVEFDDKITKQQLEIDYLKSKLNN